MCKRLIVDALTALLDGPHAQRAFLLKAVTAGDVVAVRVSTPYAFADSAATAVSIRILPG